MDSQRGFFPLLRRVLLWLVGLLPLRLQRFLLALPYREPHRRWLLTRRAPAEVQRSALRQIIERNKRTEFGRAHAFDQIQDAAAFAARVPLRTYAELAPYIARHQRGEADVLVAGPLVGFALSGGSRGRRRALPVNAAGLEQWLWLEDLLMREAICRVPHLTAGVALHLLPVFSRPETGPALPLLPMPVLALHQGRGLRIPSAVPLSLFSVPDEATRFYLVLRLALHQPVGMVRAASPGTLTILAEHLERLGPRLCDEVAAGRIEPPGPLEDTVRGELPALAPDRELAARLQRSIEERGRLEPAAVWPRLGLLVCPTSGPSRTAAARLSDRYGALPVLDPGYRAAEGAISLPSFEPGGGLVALGGQFIEFLPADSDGPTLMPEELRVGERYQPVVTGPSGLYRYLMDDITEVTQLEGGLPRLALAGRARCRQLLDSGSLGEEEVREALVEACRACGVTLSGFTGWLQPPEPPAGANSGGNTPDGAGWIGRLLRRASAVTSRPRPPAPSLAVAVEPLKPLDTAAAERLAQTLDSELGRRSAAYDRQRTRGLLAAPLLLVLRPGSFARRSHRRLAEGASDGHAPVPPLSDDGFVLDTDEVLFQV